MASTPNQPPCGATRLTGEPCRAPALPGARYCFAHHPDMAAERRAARSKGGRNRSSLARAGRLAPLRLQGLYARLERTLDRLEAGDGDPATANAIANVAGKMIAALTAGELEQRVRDLEARNPDPPRRRWPA